jgi:Ni/Co efflux regulator RcnB
VHIAQTKQSADANFLMENRVMQRFTFKTSHILALAIAGTLVAVPALADKPSWKEHGKADKHQRHENQSHDWDRDDRQFDQRDERDYRDNRYFDDRHRTIINNYYAEQFHSGHCPPGLAKKHNGCMPPGQAKKWQIGRPLPHDVVYYDLPSAILAQMGLPQPGYRYARVDSDILLLSIGTGMVVDAIMGLSGN